MKKLMIVAGLACLFTLSVSAYAGPQQEKMKSCNADAKVKAPKGEAHKAFMSSCLKGEAAAAPAAH